MEQSVHQAISGDRRALESLVREHYDRVYRFCARRLGEDLAWDAAQETFVTMQKTIQRFRGDSRFEVWLFGVASNICRNHSRKNRREIDAVESWFDEQDAPTDGCPADTSALQVALKRLSPEHREVVLLHEIEGLTYKEIGLAIGVPEGTVKSRLYHAFVNLRTLLGAAAEGVA